MAVEFFQFRKDASGALKTLENWLAHARYETYGDLKLCSDLELVKQSADLLEHLPEDIKIVFNSPENDVRLIAIHFDGHGSSVPMQDGSRGLLIPIVANGTAKVEGQRLAVLDYVRLTRQALVEPDFQALLLTCPSK